MRSEADFISINNFLSINFISVNYQMFYYTMLNYILMKPKSLYLMKNLILSDPQLCQNDMVSYNKSIIFLPTTCFFHKEVTSKVIPTLGEIQRIHWTWLRDIILSSFSLRRKKNGGKNAFLSNVLRRPKICRRH